MQKLCLGQVVTIVLGQVVATVTKLGRLVPIVQPASCVLTMTERTTRLSMEWYILLTQIKNVMYTLAEILHLTNFSQKVILT